MSRHVGQTASAPFLRAWSKSYATRRHDADGQSPWAAYAWVKRAKRYCRLFLEGAIIALSCLRLGTTEAKPVAMDTHWGRVHMRKVNADLGELVAGGRPRFGTSRRPDHRRPARRDRQPGRDPPPRPLLRGLVESRRDADRATATYTETPARGPRGR